jgi:hypothetical protein
MKSCGDRDARQGKNDDLPLVAKQHVVDVTHVNSRRRLMLSWFAAIHICQNSIFQ